MKKIKCAVIGSGYLGKFHAEKFATLPDSELIAVVDIDEKIAQEVADKYNANALNDYQQIIDKVDAVSIVVPTSEHYRISRDFLAAGVHVLVEKPITVSVDEANDLIKVAHENDCILQVGHLERFNPAIMALDLQTSPLFIESHRLATFNPRANDVSVVLDLMIHDIDIILDIADSEVDHMEASGIPVLTNGVDIANARIVFTNGCVANVTASRVSLKMERKMRLFMPHAYYSVDFMERTLTQHKTGKKEMFPGIPEIETNTSTFASSDALLEEVQHFLTCIQQNKQPLVTGEAGRRALETAIQISTLLENR